LQRFAGFPRRQMPAGTLGPLTYRSAFPRSLPARFLSFPFENTRRQSASWQRVQFNCSGNYLDCALGGGALKKPTCRSAVPGSLPLPGFVGPRPQTTHFSNPDNLSPTKLITPHSPQLLQRKAAGWCWCAKQNHHLSLRTSILTLYFC